MSTFKLLDLPLLPFATVIKFFETIDVFELSLTSKRARERIQRVNLKVFAFGFNYREDSIAIFVLQDQNTELLWFAFTREVDPLSSYPIVRHLKIGRCRIGVTFKKNISFKLKTFSIERHAWVLLDYCSKLFHPASSFLQLDVNMVHNYRLLLKNHAFHKCFYIYLYGMGEATDRNTLSVLDSLVVGNIETVRSVCQHSDSFEYEEFFKRKSIEIRYAKWVLPYHLLTAACESFYIEYNNFTEADLNSFILHWFNGNNKKLKSVIVGLHHLYDIQMEVILDGLEVMEYDGKRRPPVYEFKNLRGNRTTNFENGLDIIRHDGVLSTIDVTDSYFLFIAWHHRLSE